jgi:hypothetical protein
MLSATANLTTADRTALVTVSGTGVADQIITITQEGLPPVLTISTNALTIAYSAGSTATFDITSNIGWMVSGNQSWLTASITSGSNNATIMLSATANPTTADRTSLITVSGTGVADQIITITQEGLPPVLTVSTNALTIAYSAGSTATFDIISNINWTISNNQNWLTVSNTNGSNNATITVFAMANPTTTIRTDTVIVLGTGVIAQKITIHQDAGTAIKNDMDNTNVLIFPNPTNTIIFINNIEQNASASIFDSKGTMVLNKQIINNQIDITELSSGIYILHVIYSDKIITKKIIKK